MTARQTVYNILNQYDDSEQVDALARVVLALAGEIDSISNALKWHGVEDESHIHH